MFGLQTLLDHGIDQLGGRKLQAQIFEKFGVRLPSNTLYQFPSVHAMTIFLAHQLKGKVQVRNDGLSSSDQDRPLCTHPRHSTWFRV